MPRNHIGLILVFGLIVIVAVSLIVFLIVTGRAQNDSLGFEIVKLIVQFLLVGVLGVVISLLVQDYNRQRDRQILINELRKTILNDLIRAYSDTKKARRILMGSRLSGTNVPFKVYDEQMKSIIDTQLALEILNHQILTSKKCFEDDFRTEIISNITTMEKYLGDIIDEYKDAMNKFTEEPDYIKLSSLPKLSSTMGKENEILNFRKVFVTPYKTAVEAIRKQILE